VVTVALPATRLVGGESVVGGGGGDVTDSCGKGLRAAMLEEVEVASDQLSTWP
jgi:hypothetical protein